MGSLKPWRFRTRWSDCHFMVNALYTSMRLYSREARRIPIVSDALIEALLRAGACFIILLMAVITRRKTALRSFLRTVVSKGFGDFSWALTPFAKEKVEVDVVTPGSSVEVYPTEPDRCKSFPILRLRKCTYWGRQCMKNGIPIDRGCSKLFGAAGIRCSMDTAAVSTVEIPTRRAVLVRVQTRTYTLHASLDSLLSRTVSKTLAFEALCWAFI